MKDKIFDIQEVELIIDNMINEYIESNNLNLQINNSEKCSNNSYVIQDINDIKCVLLNKYNGNINKYVIDHYDNKEFIKLVEKIVHKIGLSFSLYKPIRKNEKIGPKQRLVSNYLKEPLKGNKKIKGKWYHYCKVCEKFKLIFFPTAKKNGKDGYSFSWDKRKINKNTSTKGNFVNTCKKCVKLNRESK